MEERTSFGSRFSPSIAEDFTTSLVSVLESRLALQLEAQTLHSSQQPSLAVSHVGQLESQRFDVPGEPRPVFMFVYPHLITALFAVIVASIHRTSKKIHRETRGD